jgi:hypothetical protein
MRCTGKSKQSGERCKKSAVVGFKVCEIHGGKTPVGTALPQTRTGRYSRHLPLRLAECYQEAIADPELLSVREDVALLDSRLSDVLAAASNQESGELWENLKQARKAYVGASGKDAEEKKQEALSQILWLINEGYQEWQSWKDIRFMLQERKQLVESERKRLVDMQQMITAERAMLLVAAISDIVTKNVEDTYVRNRIAADIERLISQ